MELNKKRDENPAGVRFIEMSFIHQWELQEEERKKAEKERKRRAARHR